MSTDKPTPEACETCGLIAWINNGDCDDLCAFCKMRGERDEYARQLAEVTRLKEDNAVNCARLEQAYAQVAALRADLAALREDINRLRLIEQESPGLMGYIESSKHITEKAIKNGSVRLDDWMVGLRSYAQHFNTLLTAEHTPAEETKPVTWTPQQAWIGGEGGDV